ncbi:MAG: peptidylprolyl isomerase [Oligoflexia bacterium]|jgi:peptidyl-prolyl cis-trans isomerase SurA
MSAPLFVFKWVGLAWVLFPVLAFAAPAGSSSKRLVDRLEASVNSSPILRSDFDKFRRTLPLRAQLDPLFAGSALAEKGPAASDSEIVSALIHDRLIASSFPVSDSEVEQEINTIQASNRIDRARLKAALGQQGFSFEDYFELIRLSTSKRNLIDRDIRTKVAISDEEVRSHYRNTVLKGGAPSRSFTAKIIVLSRQNYRSETALRETAERAIAALKSGDTFEEVVLRYSDDPSKEVGGDLGILQEEQVSPEFRKALTHLRPGQVSGIEGSVKTRLMILKLLSVNEGHDARFERIKEELRNQLAASEYQNQIQLWLAREEQNAHVHRASPLVALVGSK